MLTAQETLILSVAAAEANGEYSARRDYNAPWGADCLVMRNLEVRKMMKIHSAGRVPLTNRWFRTSTITDAGRKALEATRAPLPPLAL
jgi:hypothetical protein